MITIPPKKQDAPKNPVEVLSVDTERAAEMLGVSEKTIYNLTKAGKITCKKVGWRSLYPVASLKAFLETPDDA